MFKKLLVLAAAAAVATGMQAKVVEDYYLDWTQNTWGSYVMGYIPTTSAEEGLIFDWPHFTYVKVEDGGANPDGYEIVSINGEDHYVVPTEDGGPMDSWGIQAHLLKQNISTEAGNNYTVTICAKANKDGVNFGVPFSWGWGNGEGLSGSVTVNSEWEELSCDYNGEAVGGASCWCVGQMYDKEARVCVKWIKVTHLERDGGGEDTTEWIEHLINGDAEGEYGEVPCAYSKWYQGRDAANGYAEIGQPVPSPIEDVDGSKVFVCHAKAVDDQAYDGFFINEDGSVKGDPQWQNQFWIQSPKAWNTNDQFRVTFSYKASKAAATDTQAHGETPGGYLHWNMLGSINFTTDWQTYSKTITVEAAANNMWSIAFNLKEYANDNDYYFDNMKWETMKLDEGYFIAGDFQEGSEGQFFDYGHAVELGWNDDEAAYAGCIGTKERPAENIMISTRRGNDTAFKTNTLALAADFEVEDAQTEEGSWKSFSAKSGAKITLPMAAIWMILVDDESNEIGGFIVDENGISSPVFDMNAPFEYYNLQGVKVANPTAGNIYIVKQGSNAIKALYR